MQEKKKRDGVESTDYKIEQIIANEKEAMVTTSDHTCGLADGRTI